MSALLGTESLAEGKQVIVVHADDFDAAKRQFGNVLPVVGCNGKDTDITPLFGRSVVLIGEAASVHASMLHSVKGDATIKVIPEELDPWAETPTALDWAKKNAIIYTGEQSTASAQDSPPGYSVIPLSDSPEPDADATLPEPPPHILESIPVEALHYPDSSAFQVEEIPPEIDWNEPVDIFSIAGPSVFREGLLPSWLCDLIADVSHRRGTAAAFTAVGTQVALSKACDPAFKLQPMTLSDDYVVIPCLWGMAVGPSSAGKDPALNPAIGPLRALDMKLRIEVVEKDKTFNRLYKRWQKQEQDWINSKQTEGIGNDTFEVPEPKREPDKRLVFSDINIPALGDFLSTHERGALLYHSEISSWLGSFDQHSNGSSERGHWLRCYEGGEDVIRRITRGEVVVKNMLAGVLGGITPSALRAALGRGQLNEDGLLQRCLIGMGGPQGKVVDAKPDHKAAAAYERVLSTLIAWDGDPSRRFILSPGAFELYEEFNEEVRQMVVYGDYPTGMQSHLGKLRGMLARQVLTMHLANQAHMSAYPSYDVPIPTQTMAQSVEFFRWQIEHIEFFWRTVIGGVDPTQSAEQKLALFILAKRLDVLTNRDIEGAIRADWNFPDLSQSQRVQARRKILENLNEAGWISSRLQGNRRFHGYATVHDVNPVVHQKFSGLAEDERQRRLAHSNRMLIKREEAAARRA